MKNRSPERASELVGGETTRLLVQWSTGDQQAFEKLIGHVHSELHRIASGYLRRERPGHILQATLLVHDAYIQLLQLSKDAGERKVIPWKNRAHFIGVVANIMRHIIVDYIRETKAIKRGGGQVAGPINESDGGIEQPLQEVIAVHEALDKLGKVQPRWKAVVELHYFGGLSFDEAGENLGISGSSAHRDYEKAQAWLYLEITGQNPKGGNRKPEDKDSGT